VAAVTTRGWRSKVRVPAILTFVCVVHGACASIPKRILISRAPSDRAIQEDDIREAVFRYGIERTQGNRSIFLNIDGKDPSDTFMARFSKSDPPVKKASGSYFKENPFPGWLRDRSTDERAVSLSVGPISWISVDKVEARGGEYCGGLCGQWGIYRLRKKGGRWEVEQYEMRAIS